MRFSGGASLAYLRILGIGLLIMLMIGFGLEMLATLRAKASDLYLPRGRVLLYWGLALVVAVGLFLRLAVFR